MDEPGEHLGQWRDACDAEEARREALAVVDEAWTARVRMSLWTGRELRAATDADRAELQEWDAKACTLPAAAPGPLLPPRSRDDVRSEVLCGCRNALGLGVRARLLGRERMLELLREVDRSFEPGLMNERD